MRPPFRADRGWLSRVVFDDQLLVDGRIDLLAAGQLQHLGALLAVVPVEPLRSAPVARDLEVGFEDGRLLAALADRNRIAGLDDIRRDVHDAAVHAEMPMGDELARLRAAVRQVQPVDDVVQTALEQLQERASGLTRNAGRLAEIVLELRFVYAVIAAHLLLLAQLPAVLGDFLTLLALRLLPRSGASALDRTLFRQAAVAFEEKFDLLAGLARGRLTAAQTANRTDVSRHVLSLKRGAASAGGSRCAESGWCP